MNITNYTMQDALKHKMQEKLLMSINEITDCEEKKQQVMNQNHKIYFGKIDFNAFH